jgi:Flp pilus assembly pilin Flp
VAKFCYLTVMLECRKNKRGQDLIEYALMAGFLAVVVAAVIPDVSVGINKMFSNVVSALSLQATSTLTDN